MDSILKNIFWNLIFQFSWKMLPRRTIQAKQTDALRERSNKKKPNLEEFLSRNDWSGALGLLQFEKNTDPTGSNADTLTMFLVYCAFHLGDYKKAISVIHPNLFK
jgi:hypothetical protein